MPPLRIRLLFYVGYIGVGLCFLLWANGVEHRYFGTINAVALVIMLVSELWKIRWRRREKLAFEVEEALNPPTELEDWANTLRSGGTAFGAGAQTTNGVALGAGVESKQGEFATVSRLPWYHRIWMLVSFPIRYLLTGDIRL